MTLISIIVPCYNQAQYLDECLQSVLDQTYQDWECIIVNDGSRDHTEEIAKKWIEKDCRFKYYYKQNGGLSSARNFGLDRAEGEIIQLLDCDDYIAQNKFEIQIKDLNSSDASISDYVRFNNNNEFISNGYITPFSPFGFSYDDLILKWENGISIPCHCILFKKNTLRFDEELKNHEDWLFWLKLFYFQNKIKYNLLVLAFYRVSENSMSSKDLVMWKGFLEACTAARKFYEQVNAKEFKIQIQKKGRIIEKRKELNLREFLAMKYPYFYNFYLKMKNEA